MGGRLGVVLAAITIGAAMLLTGCKEAKKPLYSHFEEIGSEGWDPRDVLEFSFEEVVDSTRLATVRDAEMRLVMRFSARHTPQGFPIAVTVTDFDGEVLSDTITFQMGKRHNGLVEACTVLPRRYNAGKVYEVSLMPVVAKESTKGLLNVGILIYD